MRVQTALFLAATFLPLAAQAGEIVSPDGSSILSFSGVVTFENLSTKAGSKSFRYGNIDIDYRFVFDPKLKLGFDLGTQVVASSGQKASVLYGALVVESPYGKVSVGTPRLVLPEVFDVPPLGGSEVVQVVADLLAGEVVQQANLLANAGLLRGVRYDVSYGPVTVNAAVHEFSDSNAPIRQIAATYDGGAWKASLGYGEIAVDGPSAREIRLGVKGQMGKLSGGVLASRVHIGTGAYSNVEAYANYDVTDRINVGAQVINLIAGGDANIAWGISGTYTTPSKLFVRSGIAHAEGQGGNLLTLALGVNY